MPRSIHIDYFMAGVRVRFLFTSCEELQTNERVFFLENLLLLFISLNFNEIGGTQCNENDPMPSVFVTFK